MEFFRRREKRGVDLFAYNSMMRGINYQKARVSQIAQKVKSREKMLQSKCNFYKLKNQDGVASIYYNEIRHLALLKSALDIIELGLTAVCERMDTLRILYQAFEGFRPVAKSINEVIKHTSFLPGDFDLILKQLVESHIELTSILHPPDANISFDLRSPEAAEVMNKLEQELEREVLNRFPDAPLTANLRGDDLAERMEEVTSLIAADGGAPLSLTQNTRNHKLTFEDKVLRYFNLKGGSIDVYGCAKYLGAPHQKVIEALYDLADEGRLKFN